MVKRVKGNIIIIMLNSSWGSGSKWKSRLYVYDPIIQLQPLLWIPKKTSKNCKALQKMGAAHPLSGFCPEG
jgi:hypothetical protein